MMTVYKESSFTCQVTTPQITSFLIDIQDNHLRRFSMFFSTSPNIKLSSMTRQPSTSITEGSVCRSGLQSRWYREQAWEALQESRHPPANPRRRRQVEKRSRTRRGAKRPYLKTKDHYDSRPFRMKSSQ